MDKPTYFNADLSFKAAAEGQLPTQFTGVAYTGDVVPDRQAVVDLATTKVDESMPLLWMHGDQVIGKVGLSSNDGKQITVQGELYSDIDEQAASIAKKALRGTAFQMSIGLFGHDFTYVERGERQYNGRTVQAPFALLQNGRVREVSVVPLGADPDTSVSLFTQGVSMTQEEMEAKVRAAETERDEAKTALATVQEELTTVRADLAALTENARKTEVEALFKAIGREFSDETAKPYLGMSGEVFAVVKADMLKTAEANESFMGQLGASHATGAGNPNPQSTTASSALAADAASRSWTN